MYIDFAIINTDLSDIEVKQNIEQVLSYNINSITVPFYLLKVIKNLIGDKAALSCFIDYPLGISDIKTRRCAIEQAYKNGATIVDIVMPQNLAANRKYDKIRDDVKSAKEFCDANNVLIRYILEYRVFDHHCLKKICEIFDDSGIQNVFPSSGLFLDNLADNILACVFLHQNSKDLNIFSSGNMWNDKHFEILNKSGLFGFRTTSKHSLKNFIDFNSANKQK